MLTWQRPSNAENIDIDGYKAWEEHFSTYMRLDDRGMISEAEVKALSVGNNPNGGYLVPTARSSRIIEKIRESSPLRQLATIETIGTEALEIPLDLEEADCGWVGEEESRGDTGTPGTGIMRIPVHELFAKPKATQSLIEDAATDIEAWLERKVPEKMSRKEAATFITGNGIKKPRGILSYDTGAEAKRGTVLAINSGGATSITSDAMVSMPLQLKSHYSTRGVWMMNRMSVLSVMLLKDGNGQYMWRPGLTEGARSSLVGHSIQMAEDMPKLAANSLSIGFGDWRSSSFAVDMSGLGQILSIGHVIGFHLDGCDFAHSVLDIEYDSSDVATVTIEPPLRRPLTVLDVMKFRPSMLVTCMNAREVMSTFTSGGHTALNMARLVEALL